MCIDLAFMLAFEFQFFNEATFTEWHLLELNPIIIGFIGVIDVLFFFLKHLLKLRYIVIFYRSIQICWFHSIMKDTVVTPIIPEG